MINMEIAQTANERGKSTPFFALSNFLYGLNFGVLGAMANAFLSISFFGDFTFFFGQIFVLVCLTTRGINAAIVTVLCTSISASIFGNDPYLVVILSLEMLIVHVLMTRGYFLFQSATLYWLTLGIPLLLGLHILSSDISAELLFINGITLGINGLMCLSIASVICWFLPRALTYQKYNSRPPRLASLIFSLCMLTVTLPAMVVASFFIWQTSTNNELAMSKTLSNFASQASILNNVEIQRHLNGLRTIASIIENTPHTALQPLVSGTAKHYELFETLIITNQYGKILRVAPESYIRQLNQISHPNISSRDYFQLAKKTLKPVVSDAIVGKGFGADYLISLAVPILKGGEFHGVVQGSILLDKLALLHQQEFSDDYQFVITDSKGKIVSRSESLAYPLLSNFDFQHIDDPLILTIPVLEFNQEKFIYSQSSTENGWKITILASPSHITSVLFDFFFMLIVATFFLLAAFAFIANSLAQKITKPLVDIATHFPNSEHHIKILQDSQVSSEMVTLTNRLIDSHEVMSNFQQQLSEQVHNKTKQLKQLNRELYSIAQKDSLTQLLNRAGFNRLALASYRNCVRNHVPMSIVLIDIDHFKVINDTYGHPFGDKCIIAVAKTILHHCKRDTDIIGRYGGEEFILMLSGGDYTEHQQRIAMIKDQIESLRFKSSEHVVTMTISAGLCGLSDNFSIAYEDVIQIADEQLYISKRQGRNRINSIIK